MHFRAFHTAIKGIIYPKMTILSLSTHPHVGLNPWYIRLYSEHKLRYFWCVLRALRPSIDSNVITTIKVQKSNKEIGKIINVTSGVQP